ncbi:hypothetical protein K438DRAFT_1767597 [Mycena galopus ATCC 62051]|nr:hypothetical protein K438DRAFT_1767597 [Mycena galopus ATCC 62051]
MSAFAAFVFSLTKHVPVAADRRAAVNKRALSVLHGVIPARAAAVLHRKVTSRWLDARPRPSHSGHAAQVARHDTESTCAIELASPSRGLLLRRALSRGTPCRIAQHPRARRIVVCVRLPLRHTALEGTDAATKQRRPALRQMVRVYRRLDARVDRAAHAATHWNEGASLLVSLHRMPPDSRVRAVCPVAGRDILLGPGREARAPGLRDTACKCTQIFPSLSLAKCEVLSKSMLFNKSKVESDGVGGCSSAIVSSDDSAVAGAYLQQLMHWDY